MPTQKVDVEHATHLVANLSMQRLSGKHCDVCICVAEKRFLAHKNILSACCEKLDSLMQDAVGQNSASQDIEIEIQGVNPLGFEKLLDYFYLGELHLDQQSVMPVWMTAAYLELPDVVARCNEYCQHSVSHVSNQGNNNNTRKTPGIDTNSGKEVVRSVSADPTWSNGNDRREQDMTRKASLGQISSLKRGFSRSGTPSSLDDKVDCEDIMHEVEQLRMQHQQLQRLQQEQARLQNNLSDKKCLAQLQNVSVGEDEPGVKRQKSMETANGSNSTDHALAVLPNHVPDNTMKVIDISEGDILRNSTDVLTNSADILRNSNPPSDFKIVTEAYRAMLYQKYPTIAEELPAPATCPVHELLQRGKPRKRKTTEQNTLNNVIRLILDTMRITESTDPRVEDALFLIMDRFVTLRENINDPAVRRSLLIKIKHSIHCKKWRTKKSLLNKKSEDASSPVIDPNVDDSTG